MLLDILKLTQFQVKERKILNKNFRLKKKTIIIISHIKFIINSGFDIFYGLRFIDKGGKLHISVFFYYSVKQIYLILPKFNWIWIFLKRLISVENLDEIIFFHRIKTKLVFLILEI